MNNLVSVLKELYGADYYDVVGAKEELIRRIKNLPEIDRLLLGINLEDIGE